MTQPSHGRPRLATGSMVLDRLTGGGIFYGSVFGFVGGDHGDKDYVALGIIPSALAQGFEALYIDCHDGVARSRYSPGSQGKFDLQAMGIEPERLHVLPNYDCKIEVLEACIPVLKTTRTVLVVDDLNSIVLFRRYETGDAQKAQDDIRRLLLKLGMAARQSGSIIVILNDPYTSQFTYSPPKGSAQAKGPDLALPPSMISGICQLQVSKLEKKKGQVTGSIHRARMIQGRSAKPNQSDDLFIDYRYGLSNLGTIVRVARQQGVLDYNEQYKSYSAPSLIGFAPKPDLAALRNYLRSNGRVYGALIQAIDWNQTPYEAPYV